MPLETQKQKKYKIRKSKKNIKSQDTYLGDKFEYVIENKPNEIWKDININEQYLKVSNYGRVKKNDKFIGYNKDGYTVIKIKKIQYFVHVLVAKAFLSKSDESKTIVHHKDENKSNNKIDNLEWVTASQNIKESFLHKDSSRKQIKVNQLDFQTNQIICTYNSVLAASKATKIATAGIRNVLKGVGKHAGGYRWELYKSEHN